LGTPQPVENGFAALPLMKLFKAPGQSDYTVRILKDQWRGFLQKLSGLLIQPLLFSDDAQKQIGKRPGCFTLSQSRKLSLRLIVLAGEVILDCQVFPGWNKPMINTQSLQEASSRLPMITCQTVCGPGGVKQNGILRISANTFVEGFYGLAHPMLFDQGNTLIVVLPRNVNACLILSWNKLPA